MIWCFHLPAPSSLSRHQGEENFKLFWPLCLAVEAVRDVRDALAVGGEGAGGASPHVSLFVSLGEFPTSRVDGDLLWPPQPGWLCWAADCPAPGLLTLLDLTQPLWRAE